MVQTKRIVSVILDQLGPLRQSHVRRIPRMVAILILGEDRDVNR